MRKNRGKYGNKWADALARIHNTAERHTLNAVQLCYQCSIEEYETETARPNANAISVQYFPHVFVSFNFFMIIASSSSVLRLLKLYLVSIDDGYENSRNEPSVGNG